MPQATKTLIVALAGVVAVAVGAADLRAETLYDIDFGTPPHTVGLPPVIGAGATPRATVTTIPFGTPTVIASLGPLTDQPCEFDSFDGQGDQIGLSLSDLPPFPYYTFDADLSVLTLESNANALFAILFDTPQIRAIRFGIGGEVSVIVPNVFSGPIAMYNQAEIVHLHVEISLIGDLWSIYLDDTLVHIGSFGGATAITNVRISSPVTPNPPGALAAIDNIVITGTSTVGVEGASWGRIKELYR